MTASSRHPLIGKFVRYDGGDSTFHKQIRRRFRLDPQATNLEQPLEVKLFHATLDLQPLEPSRCEGPVTATGLDQRRLLARRR